MYVCLCNAVTDQQICSAVDQGVSTYRDLRKCLGIAAQCGKCGPCAKKIFYQAMDSRVDFDEELQVA